jgi:hypothetical protein
LIDWLISFVFISIYALFQLSNFCIFISRAVESKQSGSEHDEYQHKLALSRRLHGFFQTRRVIDMVWFVCIHIQVDDEQWQLGDDDTDDDEVGVTLWKSCSVVKVKEYLNS